MPKKQHPPQPVEFVNVPNYDNSNYENFADGNSVITTDLQSIIGSPKLKQSYDDESSYGISKPYENEKSSQLDEADSSDHVDKFISFPFSPERSSQLSVSQPSLSRTYDSAYDSDFLTSNDEFSSDNNTVTRRRRASKRLPRTIYPDYVDSDVPPTTFVKAYRRRKGKRPSIESRTPSPRLSIPETSSISSIAESSSSSSRLREMKNRLRSLEVQYKHQKRTPVTPSLTSTPEIDVTSDFKEPPVCIKSPQSKLKIQSCHEYEGISPKERIIETVGEIIGIGMVVSVFYMIFMLYKDSLSVAMQGSNIVL